MGAEVDRLYNVCTGTRLDITQRLTASEAPADRLAQGKLHTLTAVGDSHNTRSAAPGSQENEAARVFRGIC